MKCNGNKIKRYRFFLGYAVRSYARAGSVKNYARDSGKEKCAYSENVQSKLCYAKAQADYDSQV